MKSIVFSLMAGAILFSLIILPAISVQKFGDYKPSYNYTTDCELVIAADVSSSIRDTERDLQRQSYASAISSVEFVKQATKGVKGHCHLKYFEFGENIRSETEWHKIHDMGSAVQFANEILRLDVRTGLSTSISNAMVYARDQLDNNGQDSPKRIADISADGVSNSGMDIFQAKQYSHTGNSITYNGLALTMDTDGDAKELIDHFEKYVIGGPGHFLYTVNSIDEMADKILLKLIDEIS